MVEQHAGIRFTQGVLPLESIESNQHTFYAQRVGLDGDQLYLLDFKVDHSQHRAVTGKGWYTCYKNMFESNYSGTGHDIKKCPECAHVFLVTYKVDEVRREETWEDKAEIERLAKEKQERTAFNLLKAIVTESPDTHLHQEALAYDQRMFVAKEKDDSGATNQPTAD